MGYFFGPATITFDAVALGNTKGGCTIDIVTEQTLVTTIDDVIHDEIFAYGTGQIRKFEVDDAIVVSSMIRNDWGSLVFTGDSYRLTLPKTRLLYPTKLNFGENVYKPFTLRFIFKYDDVSGAAWQTEVLL